MKQFLLIVVAALSLSSVARAASEPYPIGPLEQLNQLAKETSDHRALDFKWDGMLLVVCEQDKTQLERDEMRMRLCWGVKPENVALVQNVLGTDGKPLWKDGLTLGCKADTDKCWYRGVLWRADRKVLGFPPATSAHFYFDGDAASAQRIAEAFFNVAQSIAASRGNAAAAPEKQSSTQSSPAATNSVLATNNDNLDRTTPRERAMRKYQGCEWTRDMGAYAYRCVVEHGGFNAHWCYDEALEVFCGEKK